MKITVALTDLPAFADRYGLVLARTGRTVDGLPETEWRPDMAQTSEQAQQVESELKDGMRWKP